MGPKLLLSGQLHPGDRVPGCFFRVYADGFRGSTVRVILTAPCAPPLDEHRFDCIADEIIPEADLGKFLLDHKDY